MSETVGPSLRDDIPNSYINAFEQDGVEVIHYLVFHWSDGDQYISDHEYQYSPGLYCDSLVTDWGQLDDSVDIAAAVNGTGNPTREFRLSLSNTSDTGWWCSRFLDPPENTKVSVYEVVADQQPILIDIFLVQNLITYAENEPSVSITLVSLNQYSDPYVGPLDPITNDFFPLVVGGVNGVGGTLYGAHPYAQLDGDVASGATAILSDRNLVTAGFPSSGIIIIDYDEIAYTGISGNSFTGCTGVVKSHSDNQYIFVKGHEYLFAFGAGPVDVAGPLYVNGGLYTGQYTIYKDLNPVQVGFVDEFPFTRLDDIQSYNSTYTYTDFIPYNDGVIDSNGFVSSYGQGLIRKGIVQLVDKSYPGAQYELISASINFRADAYKGSTAQGTYYGSVELKNSSYTGNIASINAVNGDVSISNYYPGIKLPTNPASWFALLEVYWNSVNYIPYDQNNQRIIANIGFGEIVLQTWYNSPGYPKKQYYTSPSLVIGAIGATSNPADVVWWFLDKMGLSGYINTASFSVAHDWYDTVGFEMVGLIDGKKRCSEALKDATRQCRSYLVYDAGEIFLKYRFPISETTPLYLSTADRRIPKSIKIQRQELVQADITGKKITGVTNSLAVRYAPSTTEEEYGSTYNAINSNSIAKFGLKDAVFDAYLITDSAYAEAIGDFWISQISFPYTVMSFTAIGTGGMLKLRIGCPVRVFTDWSNIHIFDGDVVKMSRRFGQISPQRRLNEWDITLVGQLKPVSSLQVSEEIDISSGLSDADMALGRGFGDTPFGCGWPGSILGNNIAGTGINNLGQLGLGDTSTRYYFTVISSSTWSHISAYYESVAAIKSDGTLWTWGDNQFGQLGLGDTTPRYSPSQVGTDNDWITVEMGYSSACAIKKDGTIWTWGENTYGELGLGDTIQRNSPVKVGVETSWLSVGIGYYHMIALRRDGTLWATGRNQFGQLGLGDIATRYSLEKVGIDTDWVEVKGCGYHTTARKSNNTLWSWGSGANGRLGLGDVVNRLSPTQIGTDSDWESIGYSTRASGMAIKNNGTLWTWGFNGNMQLGLGDTIQRNSPVQVGTDTDWRSGSIGFDHGVAVKHDNSIWAWGTNSYGQFGNGTTTTSSRPLLIDFSGYASQARAAQYLTIVKYGV